MEKQYSPCGIRSTQNFIAQNNSLPDTIPYGQSLSIAANATHGVDDPSYKTVLARDIALSRTSGIDSPLRRTIATSSSPP